MNIATATEFKSLALWPDKAPGETSDLVPEVDTSKSTDSLIAGRPIIRLSNVSHPTITIYKPEPAKDTGAAVLVCPGGSYYLLAMDLEGTEVCAWLNSIGVTAILLKYRVPVREGLPRYVPPLQDAQRAFGMIRYRAKEWGVDPTRMGILGFSAGGHLSASLTSHHATRSYPVIDAADQVSCRPDFCLLIYPAYLNANDGNAGIAPELIVSATQTPPTFITQAQDDYDYLAASVFYYLALKNAKVPAELHLYPRGGHGYGLRRTDESATSWPDRAADWLKAGGWLKPAK